MKPLGLYLHIPFCKSKCLYCDFCSFPHPRTETVEAYVTALCNDLTARASDCADYTVDTVYFGGGTPTLLSAEQLERIMNALTAHYHLSPDTEITAECNPATAERSLFLRMRRAGWNRLSIGLQSAQQNELRALGRLHSFEDFCKTWEDALSAGFTNLSADVMFGIPEQTVESFADTLEKVLACAPKHLSAYALTVEEGTPFGRRGEEHLRLPDEETVRRMYLDMIARLNSVGLLQYEISNFAKVGYESRHNLKYWNTDAYLGFGPAAFSDFGGERFGNSRDAEAYLRGEDITAERERPNLSERRNESVMLGMRLARGISLQGLAERFGESFSKQVGASLERYRSGGFVQKNEDGYAFTPEGMLVSNSILSEILDF